nr:unnamed protein product [Callosobruchus chinensis]
MAGITRLKIQHTAGTHDLWKWVSKEACSRIGLEASTVDPRKNAEKLKGLSAAPPKQLIIGKRFNALMDECNLCLQDSYPLVNTDLSKRLSSFIKNSYLPNALQHHSNVCEMCLQNFTTFINFHDIVISTEEKIKFIQNELSCEKIDLKSICDGANVLHKCQHCRVCLKPVKWLGIYLYKNDTNILDFTLLLKMFSFCNLVLDYKATDHPILCKHCFEMLQITYNFKKTIMEAFEMANNYDKSISTDGFEIGSNIINDLMCQANDDQSNDVKVNITNSDPKLQYGCFVAIERIPDILPNPVYMKTIKHKSFRKLRRQMQDKVQESYEPHLSDNDALIDRINQQTQKSKHVRSYMSRLCIPKQSAQSHAAAGTEIKDVSVLPLLDTPGNPIKDVVNPLAARKRRHYNYTKDDLLLHKLYYKHTKFETEHPFGYWEIITKEWNEITNSNTLSRTLKKKLYWQLSQGIIPKDVTDTIKAEVKACLEHNPQEDPYLMEHDYQLTHSNDILDDADIEMWFPEPKTEPLSESEMEGDASPLELDHIDTPPLLERMDPPTLASSQKESLRSCIEHNYSLLQKHEKTPKNRCTECFFTTQVAMAANRHVVLHETGKVRIYECPICTYRITSKEALKIHKREHYKNDGYEFKCKKCCFTTQTTWAAEKHIFAHEQGKVRILECPCCSYRITSKHALRRHMSKHSKDKGEFLPTFFQGGTEQLAYFETQ